MAYSSMLDKQTGFKPRLEYCVVFLEIITVFNKVYKQVKAIIMVGLTLKNTCPDTVCIFTPIRAHLKKENPVMSIVHRRSCKTLKW